MISRSLGHRAPLLWMVLPMIAGLSAARAAQLSASGWLLGASGAAVLLAAAAAWRKPVWFGGCFMLAMFFAGAASYTLHRPRIADWDFLPPREARVSLRVDRVFPQPDAKRAAGLATIVGAGDPLQEELIGHRVYFSLNLRRGDAVPIRSAVIRSVGVIANLPLEPPPGSFEGYLADAGIHFRLSRGRVLGEERAPSAYHRFCSWQAERFAAILQAGVDRKRPELAAVLRAMLLGQQHELSDEQDALFRQTGTMHVFSISGLHIAVIAGGLHALLLLMRLPAGVRFVAELAALWLYVDITGAAPSAVRAFAMVAAFETSLVLRVPRNPLAALAASALLVMWFAPLQVFSASFQMSYGIVAALLLLGLPLADQWKESLPLFRDLPPVTWTRRHRVADVAWRGLLSALALGLSASLVSAITGVMFFGLLTPGALLANLWLIPVSSLAIIMGFISLVCGLVGLTPLSVLANHGSVLVLWGVERGVQASALLPGAWLAASFRPGWAGSVAFTLLLVLLATGYARRWKRGVTGYWTPFALVALTLAVAVKLG